MNELATGSQSCSICGRLHHHRRLQRVAGTPWWSSSCRNEGWCSQPTRHAPPILTRGSPSSDKTSKYDVKPLVKPSKKNTHAFMEKVRGIIDANKSVSQTALIGLLNPAIRGWANYHQHSRPRRRSTGWTMKSGGHSGSGPDADIPRNHAPGSRSNASQWRQRHFLTRPFLLTFLLNADSEPEWHLTGGSKAILSHGVVVRPSGSRGITGVARFAWMLTSAFTAPALAQRGKTLANWLWHWIPQRWHWLRALERLSSSRFLDLNWLWLGLGTFVPPSRSR